MPRPAVAAHDRAGRIESTRLAFRFAAEPPSADAALPVAAEGAMAEGASRWGPLAVAATLRSEGARARVELRVRNASDAPVHLSSAIAGFVWTGRAAGALRYLRHGWQSWSFTGGRELDDAGAAPFPSGPWLRGLHHAIGAVPVDRAGWHESDLVTAIGGSTTGPALVAGVQERGASFGVVYARRDGNDVRVEIEWAVDAALAPGAELALEPGWLALGDDAGALLEEYAWHWGREAGARAAQPFRTGWCTWYHFFHDVSESDVLRNLEALAAARDELPVEVVQIDDGYQRAIGDWLETNERFPRGIAPLAAEIRDAGFAAGIWTAPFCVVAESALFEARRAWLLRRGDDLFRGLLHPAWTRDASVYALDTSRDDVCEHLATVFASLVDMGFSYLKLDFLYAAGMRADAWDPHASRAARLRRGLEAIRAGAGEEAFLLGCGCPLGAAVGVVDGMRIGPDVAPAWHAVGGIPGIEETVPSTRSAVRSVLARAWMHRRLWQNDPDCLMARATETELSDAERRTLAAAIAATGGMVLFSDDVPRLSHESRDLVRETLEVAREADALGLPGRARALDLLAAPAASGVAAGDAGGAIVALVNAGDTESSRSVDLAGGGPVDAAETLLGTAEAVHRGEGRFEARLAPHASALLRAHRSVPLVVCCDFDGTFSVQDVGATLARRHGPPRRPEVWDRYARGEITAWDYNLEVLDGLELPLAALDAFLRDEVQLDPGARALVDWCEDRGVPFRVLSDGFDWNLNRLQEAHGVRFSYDANRLRYDRGRWRIAAGSPDPSCECGTGVCKRSRIEALRARHPEAEIVHIGNGRVSDTCGALAADVAFAKGTLAEELAVRGAPFEAFETLLDVAPRLEELLGAKGARDAVRGSPVAPPSSGPEAGTSPRSPARRRA